MNCNEYIFFSITSPFALIFFLLWLCTGDLVLDCTQVSWGGLLPSPRPPLEGVIHLFPLWTGDEYCWNLIVFSLSFYFSFFFFFSSFLVGGVCGVVGKLQTSEPFYKPAHAQNIHEVYLLVILSIVVMTYCNTMMVILLTGLLQFLCAYC